MLRLGPISSCTSSKLVCGDRCIFAETSTDFVCLILGMQGKAVSLSFALYD